MIIASIIIAFTIIILIHELGHFWAARRAGIHVVEFSLGMGPRLLKYTSKKSGTMYSFKAFPIGGSCQMLGEDESDDDPCAFGKKHVGWRIITIAGGAIMNFALAFIIATIISMFHSGVDATVADFSANSPIREAGVQIGDRIVRINNRNVGIHGDFHLEMMRADGSPIDIVVLRDGQRLNFTIQPYNIGTRYILGFHQGVAVGPFFSSTQTAPDGTQINVDELPWVHRNGFFDAIGDGFRTMIFNIRLVFFGLSQLITGQFAVNDIMGPIGIVSVLGDEVGQTYEIGGRMAAFWTIMGLTALLSANLGVMNLLPLPALDGGRLIFLFLEAIRRKPINPDKEGMVHFAGFVLLMVLVVFVAYNDIVRLITG